MLGLGETDDEVYQAMDDLVEHGLDIFTLGQYLQPTKMHLAVAAYVHPTKFEHFKEEGLKRGLKYVEAGPLVRSSYRAERHVHVQQVIWLLKTPRFAIRQVSLIDK